MTKALVIAALTLASVSAFASKSRVNSLQGSKTVAWDVQDMFTNPAKATALGSLMTIEFGGKTLASNTAGTDFAQTAEGGFLRADDNKVWGLYLGRKSFENYLLKGLTGATTNRAQTNPIELMYGMKAGSAGAWAVSLNYSQGKDTSATAGEAEDSAYGVRGGFVADNWNAYALVGLASTGKATGQDYKGEISTKVGGEFDIHDIKLYASYLMAGGKNDTAAATTSAKIDASEVGVEHKLKTDASHFFYGAKLATFNMNHDKPDRHLNTWRLPLYFGIEADAASWLVVRAAFSQSLVNAQEGSNQLLGTTPETHVDKGTYADPLATLGVGMKFAKLMIDGTLSAGSSGNLNFNDGSTAAGSGGNFMSEVSATYMF